MKKRIIINFTDDIEIKDVLVRVLEVINGGKVSQTGNGIKHYCWLTSWTDGVAVSTNRKKNENSESFTAWRLN